jgi:hypothetical protein
MGDKIEFRYQEDCYDVDVGVYHFKVSITHKNKKVFDIKVGSEFGSVKISAEELKAILKTIKEGNYEL